ncbi:MAG: VanZ family protein, partial [Chloroflexi bacterium]|nr:VanZ family protein [Chloroflexota bacterium]
MWTIAFLVYLALLVSIIALAYLGHIPAEIAYIPAYDTIGHVVLLGIAAYLLHRALNRRTVRVLGVALPLGPLLVALVALLEELAQGWSPRRTASPFDLAADFAGIALAWAADRWR